MSKGRILLVDNDTAFFTTRKEFLEAEGYQVLTASNPGDAEVMLKDTWVHLAITNLRLLNDTDDRDISGLTLIREADPVIPKIILTAYPIWEAVRKALGPAVEGLPPAVDFVAKKDGAEAMLSAVERAFDKHVKINYQLDIQFRSSLSFLVIVSALNTSLASSEAILLQANEVEDLFRKLFPWHTRVLLYTFSLKPDGVGTMHVRAISTRGTDRFVVKCGSRKDVTAAIEQGAHRPVYRAETLRYAAVVYKMRAFQIAIDVIPRAGKVIDFLSKVISLVKTIFGP